MSVLPADFEWHQSSVATMLRCPRKFELRYVQEVQADHRATGFAAQLGTADHAAIELVLHEANEGRTPKRNELRERAMDAFLKAVERLQDEGGTPDDDGVDRAIDRLETERLDRLELLAADPRIRGIEWVGIEWPFEITEAGGRRWRGTLDAWGWAREDVDDFGVLGRERVHLARGEGVLADWKTGELPGFGTYVERTRSVQLAVYGMSLNSRHPGEWRTFLASVPDLDRPKAPTDEDGKRIPKRLPKRLNPAFVEAHTSRVEMPSGVVVEQDLAAIAKSRKKPKDEDGNPIPKWLEQELNPAFVEACERPKGPVFHEARVDYGAALHTIASAIRQAELGLFPASGALTGQCSRCPYSTVCIPTQETNS